MVNGDDHVGMWLYKTIMSYNCQSWCAQRGRERSTSPDPTGGISGRRRVAHGLSVGIHDFILFPVAERS